MATGDKSLEAGALGGRQIRSGTVVTAHALLPGLEVEDAPVISMGCERFRAFSFCAGIDKRRLGADLHFRGYEETRMMWVDATVAKPRRDERSAKAGDRRGLACRPAPIGIGAGTAHWRPQSP